MTQTLFEEKDQIVYSIKMNKFSKTQDLVLKHWPAKRGQDDPLVRKFTEIAELSSLEEQDIAEFCEALAGFVTDTMVDRELSQSVNDYLGGLYVKG